MALLYSKTIRIPRTKNTAIIIAKMPNWVMIKCIKGYLSVRIWKDNELNKYYYLFGLCLIKTKSQIALIEFN